MGLAGCEHGLCLALVERDGGDNGTPLLGGDLGERVSANQLILARLEIDGGDSAAETTGKLGQASFDGTREDLRRDGLRTPTVEPFFV